MDTNTNGFVRVMRSHDFSHFEICLPLPEIDPTQPLDAYLLVADDIRKEAARLADKAVAQYQIAKENAGKLLTEKFEREQLKHRVECIRKIEEGQRTIDQQAQLKAFDDEQWVARRRYDYEDDWQDDRDED